MNNEAQIGLKLRTVYKQIQAEAEKVKVFLVETLLNLVIYIRNVRSKNREAPHSFTIH